MSHEPFIYDLVLLLNPEAEDERRQKILDDVEALIAKHGGEIVGTHDWGVRATAYPIHKRADAEYHLLQMHATNPLLDALNHTLKITDGVQRFRIVKLRPGTPAPPDLSAAGTAAAAAAEAAHVEHEAVPREAVAEPAEA